MKFVIWTAFNNNQKRETPRQLYRARWRSLRLLRWSLRTRFLRHFHLILALAFFQGFDLCAMLSAFVLSVQSSLDYFNQLFL